MYNCTCSARHRKKIKIKIDFADFEKRSKIRFVNSKPAIGQSDSRLRRSIDQKNMGDKSAIKIGKKMAAENAQLRARGFPEGIKALVDGSATTAKPRSASRIAWPEMGLEMPNSGRAVIAILLRPAGNMSGGKPGEKR